MFINFIFPNVCGLCGKAINKGHVCDECKDKIEYIGFQYIPFIQSYCFDELHCNYYYDDIVRRKMLDYKFNHKKYLSKAFAEGIIFRYNEVKPDFDLIIPVPIHKSRLKERGYNQSELIAKIVSKQLDIKEYSNVLIKSNKNKKQSKLTKDERIKNVKGVFEVKNNDKINNKTILLIDDIYTTGATVNECSRILKRAGAKKIIVYTVAKATINSHID